jgi:hypothetical protein
MPVCQFLDDGFACFDSQVEAIAASEHIWKDLLRTGVVWSIKKCVWSPEHELDWIGIIWNCEDGSIKIKERRVEKLLRYMVYLLDSKSVSARALASFTGQVISLMPVVGDLARLYSRYSQVAVAKADSWDAVFNLDSDIISKIQYWKNNL